MTKRKAYEPEEGYKYQIFCRSGREWEHCDYAKGAAEKKYLIKEYSMAYGSGFEFDSILLPAKFWPRHARSTTSSEASP